MTQIQLLEATPLSTVARQHAQSEPSSMLPDAAAGRTMPSAEAMMAPRFREQCRPPARPDRRPSPRGGHPAPSTASAAARPAGFARLAGAALLALSGSLALPATAQAQPPAPTGFSAEAGDGQVTLSWNPPGSGLRVTHHDYRFKTDGSYGNWIEIDDSGPGEINAFSFTVTMSIVNDTAYTFQLRAVSTAGDGDEAEAGPVTPTAATVTSVAVVSAPQSGDTYRLYETMRFAVTFSHPVKVDKPGPLRLEVGLDVPGGGSGSTVEAVFSGQSRSPTVATPQRQAVFGVPGTVPRGGGLPTGYALLRLMESSRSSPVDGSCRNCRCTCRC